MHIQNVKNATNTTIEERDVAHRWFGVCVFGAVDAKILVNRSSANETMKHMNYVPARNMVAFQEQQHFFFQFLDYEHTKLTESFLC